LYELIPAASSWMPSWISLPTWTEAADLIRAIGSLWTLVAVVLAFYFRKPIVALISGLKLKKANFPGGGIELEKDLDKLEAGTKGLEEKAAIVVPPDQPQPQPTVRPDAVDQDRYDYLVRDVLSEAGTSPKAALMLLSAQLEAESRRLIQESTGEPPRPGPAPLHNIGALVRLGVPNDLARSMRQFWEIRSRIVHGYEADEANVLRAIDIGLRLLSVLKALHGRPKASGEGQTTGAPC
jgi:hypothetical protein